MVGEPLLLLSVEQDTNGDLAELDHLTYALRDELLALAVEAVDPVMPDEQPQRAKGLGAVAGALVVQLATGQHLRVVIRAVRSWVTRNNRTVTLQIGPDVLKMTGVTSAQQDRLIEAWVARHDTST